MVEVWRLVPGNRAVQAFDGEGARLYGGRWNSPGLPVVYTGGSRALAALEILVHLGPAQRTTTFLRFTVQIPPLLIDSLPPDVSPEDYRQHAAISPETQALGDHWLRHGQRPVLKVPSVIIPEEPNYLINPRHPDLSRIRIGSPEPFAFDLRLLAEGNPGRQKEVG
jgi:RES domain-containing protein